MRLYKIIYNGADKGTYALKQALELTGLTKTAFLKRYNNEKIIDGLRIIYGGDTNYYMPNYRKKRECKSKIDALTKIVPLKIVQDKKESSYDIIKRCLKTYGNTNIVKKELKYLEELKKEFNISIEHYGKSNIKPDMIPEWHSSQEDWIITWLDYGKEIKNDK